MSITNARAAMTDRNWRAALDHLNELDPGDDPAQAYHLSGTCFLEVEDLGALGAAVGHVGARGVDVLDDQVQTAERPRALG